MTGSLGKGIAVASIAETLLAVMEEHFAAAAVALPERRYVVAGDPLSIAWDCEQLVVGMTGIGWGQAEDRSSLSGKVAAQTSVVAVRHVIFSIQLVRCTPSKGSGRTNALPEVADMHAAGLAYMRDAGLISQALVTACARLRAGLDLDGMALPGAVNPLGPDGGFHAVDASIAITSGNLV